MESRRTLLQVTYAHTPDVNGLAHRVLDAFDPTAWNVVAVALTGSVPVASAFPPGVDARSVGTARGDLKGWRRRRAASALAAVLGGIEPDLVVAHRLRAAFIAQRALGDRLRQGLAVTHGHNTLRRWTRRIAVRRALLPRWHFAGVSEAVRDILAEHGIPRAETSLLHNGLDFDVVSSGQVDAATARETLGLPSDGFVVGTVCALEPRKGVDVLLSAVAQTDGAHLAVVGTGREEQALRARASDLGTADRVTWCGRVPEAWRLMRAFDGFALASRAEAFGMVLLEAMAASRPIVATDVDGIPEVLGDEGLLVPAEDVAAFASALTTISAMTPDERAAAGARLHTRGRTHFDIDRYHAAYRHLANSLTS